MTGRPRSRSRLRWPDLLAPVLAAAAWAGFVALAVVAHEPDRGARGWFSGDYDLVAFSAALAVAGTIAFAAAMALYGSLWRGLVSVVVMVFLLPLPGAEAYRRARAIPWSPSKIVVAAQAGAGLGVAPGLVMAALLIPFVLATRRRLSWRIGLAVAALVVVAMTWVVPPAIYWWWQFRSADIAHRTLDRRSAFGGMVGGSLGAIAGAVIGGMMARWRPAPSGDRGPAFAGVDSRGELRDVPADRQAGGAP